MKELATSMAYFETLITDNYLYVDKTRFIHKIIKHDVYYFLSRPRRFGKSLTINTLNAVYEGKKELFKGLYLGSTDWPFNKHPIIRLDFNQIESTNLNILQESLFITLQSIADKHNLRLFKGRVSMQFNKLVLALFQKYNKKVVVLIDEYDKPIINHLGLGSEELSIALENQKLMRSFFDNLKPLEQYLEKVFITGVSKFSKVSIFSSLNNLNELDLHPEYADFLGYTDEELHANFDEYFQIMADSMSLSKEALYAKFKSSYNGFRFTTKDVKVYNPFSTGLALTRKSIENYWFSSGTPTFLINLIKEKRYDITQIDGIEVDFNMLNKFDITDLTIESIFFQAGYLTIQDVLSDNVLSLTFPNLEVRQSFFGELINAMADKKIGLPVILRLSKALQKEDYDTFFSMIKSSFASIPYHIIPQINNEPEYERYYHSLFYMMISLMNDYNMQVFAEVLTNTGRIDMTLEMLDKIFIFKFKIGQSAEQAVQQIKDKKYAERYLGTNKKIILVGINFGTKERNITDYLVEM